MESNAQEKPEADPPKVSIDEPFDPDVAALILELSPRQKAFADAILAGCNQTRAAELAGYSGKDSALRSHASQVAKSPKVTAYLSWARAGRSGGPIDAATADEVEKKLAEHLRGNDKAISLRAAEMLAKLHTARAEARANQPAREPKEILAELFETSPTIAVLLASRYGMPWSPGKFDRDRILADLKRAADEAQKLLAAFQADPRPNFALEMLKPKPPRQPVSEPLAAGAPPPTDADRHRERAMIERQNSIGSEAVSAADQGQSTSNGSPMAGSARSVPVGSNTLGMSRAEAAQRIRSKRSFL